MSSTLSTAQIKEAVTLAGQDLINQLNSKSWSVPSLHSENSYTVKVADTVHAYDLWCTCSGWKFKKGAKDCKHCEAVRIETKTNGSQKTNKKAITTKRKSMPRIKKDMTETKRWWNSLNQTESGIVSDEINQDCYANWSENEDNIQWKIHEYFEKEIEKDLKNKDGEDVETELKKLYKNIKVKCWHCETEQKIQSYEASFNCTNCKEQLWTGEGGYVLVRGKWK